MPISNLSKHQQAIGDRQLTQVLTVGLGSSILLHLGLIAGVAYWGQPIRSEVEESLAITPIELVDLAIAPATRSPVIKPIIQPSSIPKIILPQPIVRPTTVKLTPKTTPKPISIQTPSKSKSTLQQPIGIKSTPKSIATAPIPKPRSKVKPSALSEFLAAPIPKKPAVAIPAPMPTPSFNPPFPAAPTSSLLKSRPAIVDPPAVITPEKISRARAAVPAIAPSPQPRSISSPSPIKRSESMPIEPTRSNPRSIEYRQPQSNLAQDPITSAAHPKPPTVAPQSNPIDRSNLSTGRSKITSNLPIDNQPTGGTPAPTGSAKNPTNSPGNRPQNRSNSQGGGGGNSVSNAAGNRPQNGSNSQGGGGGNSVSNATPSEAPISTSGSTKLECIKYCEIPKLKDLQDIDGGKDRLRIRIVVDANGAILDASIVKSSGNSQIDAVVLTGIKQMQLSPPGKEIRGIVRANILIRSAKPTVIYAIA